MRASSLILASLGFVHDFRTGQLEPDEFRGTPREFSDPLPGRFNPSLTLHSIQSGYESVCQALWHRSYPDKVSYGTRRGDIELTRADL